MKVAFVHYWLVNMRGGEKVLAALCEMFPTADVFTHAYDPSAISETITRHTVRTTFVQRLPRATRYYQRYLPLMPLALEQLDLRQYDLVISSESGPSKGVLVAPHTLHVCYCHTPMRYLWDMYPDYLSGAGRLTALLMRPLAHYLRLWDLASSYRVDHFVANSNHVAKRIARTYRRHADVIPPPVATHEFSMSEERGDFYLVVGQLVGYKKADLAVRAFNANGRQLVVIGEGEQLSQLRQTANSNVKILGRQSFSVIKDHFARCKALVFPGEEDFGIVPVEAMASGRPVIAYGKGGVLDTVEDGKTGIFFHRQTPEDLTEAVERYEATERSFSSREIVSHAQQFSEERFKARMKATIDRLLQEKRY